MNKYFSLRQLAEYLQADWSGDADVTVSSIANLARAEPHHLSFLSKKQFVAYLDSTLAGIVIVKEDVMAPEGLNLLRVPDPYLAYAKISRLFCQRPSQPHGIHPSAFVDPTALISPTAAIGPGCSIAADVEIGENTEIHSGAVIGAGSRLGAGCIIYPNVVIYHGVVVGDRVTIHSNTVIGADGFGFAPSGGKWIKIYQLGGVRIGNDVEIGASTTIDRGAIDDTIINDGAIIDDQVHIAHNCVIGQGAAIAGCTGIAGSTEIGANCTIGGLVGIGGHLKIADNVHFNGSTVVTRSISEPGVYSSGTVVQEVHTWRKNAVRFGQLDQWVERIKKLEKVVTVQPDGAAE
jgi:UDP-3-O-[3-hydroxymyristoyl] glucosamine N-acyltransferase